MICPVCGDPKAEAICARCGTDLRALAGEQGEVHLEIVTIRATDPDREARKPAA